MSRKKKNRNEEVKRRKKDALQLLGSTLASLASRLLGQKVLMDVGEDTTLSDGDVTEKLVQLFVIAWDGC